jgi:hypothetical protein
MFAVGGGVDGSLVVTSISSVYKFTQTYHSTQLNTIWHLLASRSVHKCEVSAEKFCVEINMEGEGKMVEEGMKPGGARKR